MVFTLVGVPTSTCTRRVATILKEKKIPYEMRALDFSKAQHKAPEFLAVQPFGQVPYIIDEDGFTLYESRAIARYVASKYRNQGNSLLPDPSDIQATALFEQAASIETSNFDPFASGIAAEKVFRP